MRKGLSAQALLIALCICCGKQEESSAFLREDLSEFSVKYQEITSKYTDWIAQHGDSLLFTGIALGSLPCGDQADALYQKIEADYRGNGDWFERQADLEDEYQHGRQVSLDGLIGIRWGMAQYAKCGRITVFHESLDHEHSIGWRVHPDVMDYVPYGFRFDWSSKYADQIAAEWTRATLGGHRACYRIHLATLNLMTIGLLSGHLTSDAFCKASSGAGLPLTDFFCGRVSAHEYLAAWEPKWYYRHQRCEYEGDDPPGSDGLDFAIMYKLGGERW